MNKNNAVSIVNSYLGSAISDKVISELRDMSISSDLSDLQFEEFVSQLYGCDENGVSNTPLQKFLSNSCSVELRDFIKQNLLGSCKPIVSTFSDNLTDDDMFNLSPRINESLENYQSRVKNYVDTLYERDQLQELAERKNILEKNNNSDD